MQWLGTRLIVIFSELTSQKWFNDLGGHTAANNINFN